MTNDEIQEEIASLEIPSPELLAEGGSLFHAAYDLTDSKDIATSWLARKWIQLAQAGMEAKDDFVLNQAVMYTMHGMAYVMLAAGFPRGAEYAVHMEQVKGTFERLQVLDALLQKGDQHVH